MTFEEKIEDGSALIGVVALGYVGLPLLRSFFDAGFHVIGFDVDPQKVRMLNAGENYLKHLGEDFVSEMSASERFEVTDDFDRLGEPDAIMICVPTPLGTHQEPDLSFVEHAADDVAKTLRPGQLIVLESTTYPGTTREIMLPRLEAGGAERTGGAGGTGGTGGTGGSRGLRCGEDFFLAYSPEREDPGRKDHSTQTIPKLVGGIDARSGELAVAMYRKAIKEVIPVSSAEVAESAKILENVYRAVNIALVNEMKVILEKMGIDIWEVIDAAATKPFGFQAFYPGPGLGGHCIPIDPYYLTWKAREVGQLTRFIELAGHVNHHMPDYVIQRTLLALNEAGKPVRGSKILVMGLAYKPDVDDVRESPSFELIEQLVALGAEVEYHDPHVKATHKMRRHNLKMSSVEISPEKISDYDCILIATHHAACDWGMIARNAGLIVDTRGAMRGRTDVTGRVVMA